MTTPLKDPPRADAKYLHLVDHLASRIRSGSLAAGERLPTFIEMQAAFKLTAPTVNRAMIALEQDGLVERRRGSGIYVLAPQCVPTQHTTIGLAGVGFQFIGQSSYWTTLLRGVRDEAGESGAQILLLDYASPEGWERADGLLMCDWSQTVTRQHVPPSLPCVSVLAAADDLASVVADDYSGSRAATEHLLQLGHRKIAHLHGPIFENRTASYHRRQAYRDAVADAGIQPLAKWERVLLWRHGHEEDFVQAGHETMSRWLHQGWLQTGCTALLCQNDATAVGAAQALRNAGLSVPDDVSLVGFDGCEIGDYFSPRLTTVTVPLREIGAAAMKMLRRQIASDQVSIQHEVLQPELLIRESTAAPRPQYLAAQENHV